MVSRRVPWGKSLPDRGPVVAGSEAGRPPVDAGSEGARRTQSAVTNGSRLLPGIDGRGAWVRRVRDVQRALVADLGGKDNVSAAQLALARKAAVLEVQLEQLEARMAEGDTSATTFDHYGRGVGHLRRVLGDLGIERKQKDVTPGSKLLELYRMEGKITEDDDE